MHPSLMQSKVEFQSAQTATPLPCKNSSTNSLKSELLKTDIKNEVKNLDKQREGSPSSTAAAKPSFSYIALSKLFF